MDQETKVKNLELQLKEEKKKLKEKQKILKEKEALKIGKIIQKTMDSEIDFERLGEAVKIGNLLQNVIEEEIDFDAFNAYVEQHKGALKNLVKSENIEVKNIEEV